MKPEDVWGSLREHQKVLVRETERLNSAIEAAEVRLQELKLGVSTAIVMSRAENEEDGSAWFEYLGFERVGSEWRLTYEYSSPDDEPTGSQPLINAARHVRVKAAAFLDKLVEELLKEAMAQSGGVKSAADAFVAFAARLESFHGR